MHALGLRYRVNVRVEPDLRRTADVAFKGLKLAIFADGCFWHGCPVHGNHPKTNAEYWSTKIERNIARNRETDLALRSRGWTVLRVWEHEDAEVAALRIKMCVESLRCQVPA